MRSDHVFGPMRALMHLPYALPLVPRYLAIIQCLDIARIASLLVEAKGAQLYSNPGYMGGPVSKQFNAITLESSLRSF
jgi:hypothetical protein